MIHLQDINKTYFGAQPLHVLKGISLDIAKGEFVSIMGASGSGKSTLLNMLAGLEKPTKGQVIIAGEHIEDKNEAGGPLCLSGGYSGIFVFVRFIVCDCSGNHRFT